MKFKWIRKIKRKTIIISSLVTMPVLAFAIGVPIAISQRDFDKSFSVKLASANGPRYFVTEIDPQQNKPKIANKDVWDILSNKLSKEKVAEYLELSSYDQVVTTIISGKKWTNGLEKFLYDLIYTIDNGPNLEIIFHTSIIIADEKIKIFTLKDYPKKTKSERITFIQSLIDNNSVIIKLMQQVALLDNGIVAKTTIMQIQNAFDKMKSI